MAAELIYLLSTGLVSTELIGEVASRGVVLDVMRFIDTEYLEGTAELAALVERPLTVVFTSVNSVRAVQPWLAASPKWRVYCISGATYAAVVELLGQTAVVGKADSAEGLAEVISREEADRSKEIETTFFCGDQRREELPAALREAGVTVREVVVYRTLLNAHKVERNYDGIAFFSPSAVVSFFSANEIPPEIPLFAIGRTTAAAIRARCPNPVITGGVPDKGMLIRTMTDHFLNKQ